MSKKNAINYGIVTQTELINIAIGFYLNEYHKLEGQKNSGNEEIIDHCNKPNIAKLESLLKMYEIETGKDYGLELDL